MRRFSALVRISLLLCLGLLCFACKSEPPEESQIEKPLEETPVPQASTVRFAVIGDYGTGDDSGDNDKESGPAELVASWAQDPGIDFIITMGDNNYDSLSTDSYLDVVCNYYGDFVKTSADPVQTYCKGATNRFYPTPGNHDWDPSTGYGYYATFFPDAGDEDKYLYYDFAHPGEGDSLIQFFSVNANCPAADKHGSNENSNNHGCPLEGSGDCADQYQDQAQWVQKRMASTSATWNLVYFHQPPYSASSHPGCPATQALDFAGSSYVNQNGYGMTAVLSGHAHQYQRIVETANPAVPFFIVGSSGRLTDDACNGCQADSSMTCAYCYDKHHGAMLVTASSDSITFEMYRDDGELKDTCTVTRDDYGAQQLTCTGNTNSDYCGDPPDIPACGYAS